MWDVVTTDRFDEWYENMDDPDRANIIADKEYQIHLNQLEAE